MGISGANIMGGNPKNGRTKDDYYATNPEAVRMLIDQHWFLGNKILEPCVGACHIANVLKENPQFSSDITSIDIVDRGYPGTIITDFLEWETQDRFDTIITNPPYSLANEFIEKCIELLREDKNPAYNGQLAMFLKIQFLEGQKRTALFAKYPPRFVYVFRKRMCVFNNGDEIDPKTGKPWATTLCNAWYVWSKGFCGEPTIRWL